MMHYDLRKRKPAIGSIAIQAGSFREWDEEAAK